ncbi:MAG: acetate--CoA ligase, partial [Myxococcales bacterium]|nr:acetate--CoA ligase [Myxococcales bacterium]
MSQGSDRIESRLKEIRRFNPSQAFVDHARVSSHHAYASLYAQSIEEPDVFWREQTSELAWRAPWTKFSEATVDDKVAHAKFFVGAKLNVTESCLDRHLPTGRRTKAALIWEGEPGDTRTITYFELHKQVVRAAAALADLGVKAGDRVAIYMGMVPETVVAMLACARLGAPHSVVFGGFSSDALRDRINDCGAKVLLTQDGAWRRGHVVPLKNMADGALEKTPGIEKVVVLRRIGAQNLEEAPVTMKEGRDLWWDEWIARTPTAPSLERAKRPEAFDAEHPLFILYTSGSTGKPKGVLHTSAGYLAGAYLTTKYVFDLRDEDVYWCTADVGWVTGHSYIVYGPLSNGATCVLYEGAPNQPDWSRFWSIIERHGVSIFYTAPTAIRAFIRAGEDWPRKHDLSSLRVLGSVGEPINPEAWMWYHRVIGGERCPIVDTWWQTETGAIMLTTLPGAVFAKPGSTGLPFFGVEPAVVKDRGEPCAANEGGKLVIKRPWPSMARTLWGDDERYFKTYWGVMPGLYFTGDGARRDEDDYYWVVGRIDDVLNVAGHRIGTAEIESALVSHPAVAEAAAVGRADELKGQALVVFVTLKGGQKAGKDLKEALTAHIDKEIGKFARPDTIRFTDALPKTRSGKIMRRLLKEVAAGSETKGDTTTLEDFGV